MKKLLEKWDSIIQLIQEEYSLSEVSVNTWLKPLSVYSFEDHIVTLISPDQMALNYIVKKYKLPLQVAISEVMNMEECEVRFILPKDIPQNPQLTNLHSEQDIRCEEAHLNPRYTFDSFIVGPNNRLAQAAALAVSESPGEVYNPLYIYGGSGLGKTHLMHSIAHFIIQNDENSKVLYVTSEDFTNELIQTIRNGNNTAMARFREKYRNIDVLLVDDIQFIIGKDSTQEEFFHTFNSLHSAKKAIIISSDKPPKDMDVLEERFRSRFEWGLIVDITPPDYETRMAILHKKEETDGISINEDIIKYIAENVKSNIRELEGALNKIVAFSRMEQKELTLDYAKNQLKDFINPEADLIIDSQYIVSVVADHFNMSVQDILGTKRTAKYTLARHISMYFCREYTNNSLKAIGQYMGGRDHSTVIHGIDKVETEMETDESLRNTISMIRSKINPRS